MEKLLPNNKYYELLILCLFYVAQSSKSSWKQFSEHILLAIVDLHSLKEAFKL